MSDIGDEMKISGMSYDENGIMEIVQYTKIDDVRIRYKSVRPGPEYNSSFEQTKMGVIDD